MRELLAIPFTDLYRGVNRATDAVGAGALPLLFAACAAGWWVYVPVHELMHAWGAQLGGATVTRLDIDPWYGARLLQRFFPYVHPGSAYAGQLAGFDTHGSDLAYALAVIFPFALTVVVGVPVLVRALRARPSAASALLFGLVLPAAWAPILSIGGDYYELGAIATSRVAGMFGVDGGRWRGDDVVAVLGRVSSAGDAIGVGASLVLGIMLAFTTYAGARLAAARFSRPQMTAL
ncbi:MAG TPA: hypothetical protein VJQ49_10565 [Casimicrobiaceae bacterium]|nr:hypothetical protein [Casimicrobiaceae bacterium]